MDLQYLRVQSYAERPVQLALLLAGWRSSAAQADADSPSLNCGTVTAAAVAAAPLMRL